MCLIAYHEPGALPDPPALRAGAAVNPHGSGHAIWTPEGFLTGNGLNSESVISEFMLFREKYPDGPALFHSRAATSGDLSAANLQPIPVSLPDGPAVLAHNGTLRGVEPIEADEAGWSDSRLFARRIFEREQLPLCGQRGWARSSSPHLPPAR